MNWTECSLIICCICKELLSPLHTQSLLVLIRTLWGMYHCYSILQIGKLRSSKAKNIIQLINSRTTTNPGISINMFVIYFWLCWVFVAACGLSLVAASDKWELVSSCGAQASHCRGFSCRVYALSAQALVAADRGLWSVGLVVVAHGLCCPAACGTVPDQGLNLFPLPWPVNF